MKRVFVGLLLKGRVHSVHFKNLFLLVLCAKLTSTVRKKIQRNKDTVCKRRDGEGAVTVNKRTVSPDHLCLRVNPVYFIFKLM